MADIEGAAIPPLTIAGAGADLSVNGGFAATQVVGTLTLREVILAGLANVRGWLAGYPFEVIERACIDQNVDMDATKVILLSD